MRSSWVLVRTLPLAACLSIFTPSAQAADCAMPGPAPSVPSGRSVTPVELKQAHDAIQVFVKALEAYSTCLDALAKGPPPAGEPELPLAWTAQADAAIDMAHQLADAYKAQKQIYDSRFAGR